MAYYIGSANNIRYYYTL